MIKKKTIYYFFGKYFGNNYYVAKEFANFKKITLYDFQDCLIKIAFLAFTRNFSTTSLFSITSFLKTAEIKFKNGLLIIDGHNFSDIENNVLYLRKSINFCINKSYIKLIYEFLLNKILEVKSSSEVICISGVKSSALQNFKKCNLVCIEIDSSESDSFSNMRKLFFSKNKNKLVKIEDIKKIFAFFKSYEFSDALFKKGTLYFKYPLDNGISIRDFCIFLTLINYYEK